MNTSNYKKTETGLIVNTNNDDYVAYMAQKKNYTKITAVETEINSIKDEISSIKDMLKQLIEASKG